MHRIRVIDSHTEGEPTRVVIDGGPDLTAGRPGVSVADQLRVFREQFDHFRSAIVNEPRGSDPLVGALVCPARSPRAACGVIFFNNVGYLNACGHGSIGLAATLLHMGRIGPGNHVVETPVGEVTLRVSAGPRAADADAKAPADMQIEIDNVASYRHAKGVPVAVEWQGGARRVHGDIAWGGNWFFLVEDHGLDISVRNLEELTAFTWAIRQGLERAGITGQDGGLIDHIELFGPPGRADADSRNFVLCPGKAYDRSPCGTGTSAKLACLYADGKLALGAPWRQESVIGSRFVGSLRKEGDALIPTISGRAFITAESTLLLDDHDPFCWGVRA